MEARKSARRTAESLSKCGAEARSAERSSPAVGLGDSRQVGCQMWTPAGYVRRGLPSGLTAMRRPELKIMRRRRARLRTALR